MLSSQSAVCAQNPQASAQTVRNGGGDQHLRCGSSRCVSHVARIVPVSITSAGSDVLQVIHGRQYLCPAGAGLVEWKDADGPRPEPVPPVTIAFRAGQP
jgi:hypothetical protein